MFYYVMVVLLRVGFLASGIGLFIKIGSIAETYTKIIFFISGIICLILYTILKDMYSDILEKDDVD